MNIQLLRSFDAVARLGSLSAAAQSLGLSQPAVTQHIKALESNGGRPLLLRHASGAELTAEGQALLPHVRHVLLAFDDLGMQIFGRTSPENGCLTIGLCAPHIAMPVLERFMTRHPGVRMEVLFDNSARLLEMVQRSRVDIAMMTLTAPLTDLCCDRLVRQQLMFLLPAGHPWAEMKKIDMSSAAGQRIILREPGSSTRHLFEETARRQGVTFTDQLMLGSREAVKEAVAAGLGLGMVLDSELGADRRLAGVAIRAATRAAEYLVCRPELARLGVVQAFVTAAREVHSSTGGE